MSRVKHFKVVSSLPATLEPDSIYYVRLGTGFDLYATTSNSPVIARPINTSSSGDVGRIPMANTSGRLGSNLNMDGSMS